MNTRWWLAALAALPFASRAGDVRIEVGGWDYDVSGEARSRGETIDFERDVDIDASTPVTFAVRVDTDSTWVPDLAASYLTIDAGGQRTVTSQPPGPVPVPPSSTTVIADADLRDLDVSLRYGWEGKRASTWFGATLKNLSGELVTRTRNDSQATREDIDETLPMLHGAVDLAIGERFGVNAEINWIASGEDRAQTWRAGADLRLLGPVGLTAAWQRRQYRVRAGSDRLDATLDGVLVGVYARWGAPGRD